MNRSVRVLVIAAFATLAVSIPVFAIVPGPELDPSSTGTGLTILAIGGFYLVERFRRRR